MTIAEHPLPPIVDADWLAAHAHDVVIADVRWYLDGRRGHDAYLRGHLPGAIWVDIDADVSSAPTPDGGRHPVPSPTDFARSLGALGIGDDATVVAYDDAGGPYAARLVWLLRQAGARAAVLDGGLAAWRGSLEQAPVRLPAVERRVVPWPAGVLRTADEVEALAAGEGIVLDARAPERYTGASALPTDVRSGHIPGARNAPWSTNLAPDGRFADPATLRRHYASLGATDATDVIVYCGSGVTACHDLLALEHIGVSASLYPGSWSAWSADGTRAVASGPFAGGSDPAD